ncbi:MAG: site-2 protease family protein [Isosphaeraceae bacterium]
METLSWFLNVFKVLFGLGLVIFFHELGHFLLAKWNGVKVEKFSIGFGPTLLGFRRGETEYVLAAIPLGGFVKMLGEEATDEASRSTDPRAYNNKTVGARMAIISAGVIMNVILGLVCFAYAYGKGLPEIPAMLGGVEPASPAYEAGIKEGDEIVAIDGHGELSWSTMQLRVRLSTLGQTLHFDIKRPGREKLIGMDIQPRREVGMDWPTIGVMPMTSMQLWYMQPPAGMPSLPDYPPIESSDDPTAIDTVVAVGVPGQEPTPVADITSYQRLVARNSGKPLRHVIERRENSDDGQGAVKSTFEVTFPAANFVDFGFRLAIEPISGIQKDSPADQAGFRKGDRIVKVNGQDDFDPLHLPTRCYESAGKPMSFEVERVSADGSTSRQTLSVTPDDTPPWTVMPAASDALDVPGLGLCYPVRPHITHVTPDSPAAKVGLKAGDLISSMTIAPPHLVEIFRIKNSKAAPALKPETVTFDETKPAWVKAFWTLQYASDRAVTMVVNKGSRPVELKAVADPSWSFPWRGVMFMRLFRKVPSQSITAALRRGWDDTIENILNIYGSIRSLILGRVALKGLAGPIRIVQFAYTTARSSVTELVHFLGFLSINLAVINFLPIPPLDGGQMAFLLAEKVRGRPLPESAIIPLTVTGIVLVVCLMIFALFQDVLWSIENWKLF